MKRLVSVLFILCLLVSLCACGSAEYEVDYGQSSLYTKEDMNNALMVVEKRFNKWSPKCKLLSVEYAGDESSGADNLEYCNSLSDGAVYAECIVFTSSFHTPKGNPSSFEPDETYTGWLWYLAREAGGEWVVVTSGYA